MPQEKDLYDGLKESFEWYKDHMNIVDKKPFFDFIDETLGR